MGDHPDGATFTPASGPMAADACVWRGWLRMALLNGILGQASPGDGDALECEEALSSLRMGLQGVFLCAINEPVRFNLQSIAFECQAVGETMPVREFEDYLLDLLDSMDKIERFIDGMTWEAFKEDEKTQFAVIRALEIIGEAVKHIPDDVRKASPDVPWKEMAGMRDVLIHDYFGIDVKTVWVTASDKISQVRPMIERLIEEKR